MSTLILNSLEVRGFRGFSQLTIERLGRVNLIVGKNNVGKSSLLEALQLYAHRGSPRLIWELLVARDESGPVPSVRLVEADTVLTALKYLFYGRKDVKIHPGSIQIGPANSLKDTLSLSVGWYTERLDKTGRQTMEPLQPEEYNTVIDAVPRFVTLPMAEAKGLLVGTLSPNELREEDCSSPWAVPYRQLRCRSTDTFRTLMLTPTPCSSVSPNVAVIFGSHGNVFTHSPSLWNPYVIQFSKYW